MAPLLPLPAADTAKAGNMGYTDCLNFCTKQYWGGFTCSGCVGGYDTQSNTSVTCDYIRGYGPKEIICFCTDCGPAREGSGKTLLFR
jgi:hypothetical protein